MRAARQRAKQRELTATGDAAYQALGLTIMALVPALFWTGVVAAIGAAIGHPVSAAGLATVAAAIATFVVSAAGLLLARAG